ncbi:unnamed protein product [Peniophora sp. CBMAI 1063]|nr:unnamed protein product [Peniophora sp. CBMAI 1063]
MAEDAVMPRLAEDDTYTWSKAADLALRHTMHIRSTAICKTDVEVEQALCLEGQEEISRSDLLLVNRDAHIPAAVRVPHTPRAILADIKSFSPKLTRPPSDFIVGGTRIWHCPHVGCSYNINLARLTKDEFKYVKKVTKGSPMALIVDDVAGALDVHLREVVDILGLAHYEAVHLRLLGLRHVIHGQGADARIRYYWQEADLDAALVRTDMRGSAARHYEERARMRVQSALGNEARQWFASLVRRHLLEEDRERKAARAEQSDYIRNNLRDLVNLNVDRVDGLFEARASLVKGRSRMSTAVREPYHALERVYKTARKERDALIAAAARRTRERAEAEATRQYWNGGEGFHRSECRGYSIQLYL